MVETTQLPGQVAGQAAPGGQTQAIAPAIAQTPTTNVDISKYSIRQLRNMLQELRNQRQELANRRQSTGDTYENATGASREGIGERLRVLDGNIIAYEREITRVGQELAARGGGTTIEVPPGAPIPPGYIDEDEAAGMAFGFSAMTLVLAVFITRRIMRRKYGRVPMPQQQGFLGSGERLERIEQAVDSIAIEVERVSENQRFMTRLMTETQLGETIKDVKKSAELAKSAAESSG